MHKKKRLYSIILITIFLLISSGQLFCTVNTYYASNCIGMKLHEIPESNYNDYEWFVKSYSENNVLHETLFHIGIEIWSEMHIFLDQGKEVVRFFSDGSRHESVYFDNLLIEEKIILSDNQVSHIVYQYFDGELLRKSVFTGEVLSKLTNYVRKSDGSLHLRQTNYFFNNLIEILIIGSSPNISKTALGRKGDFSVIKSYPNGMHITEKWVSGLKVTLDQEIQTTQSGELVVTEKNPDGTIVISSYTDDGSLSRQVIETDEAIETVFFYYDKENYLITKTVISQDNKIIYEYINDEDGNPEIELMFENGLIKKKTIFNKTGNREEIYKEGSLYLIITYAEDGQTIKDSKFAGE